MSNLPDRRKQSLDLDSAKFVLERARDFSEANIHDNSDMSQLGGIDRLTLRQALTVSVEDLIDRFGKTSQFSDAVAKQSKLGSVRLMMPDSYKKPGERDRLELLVHQSGNYIIRSELAMRDDYELAEDFGLFDYRHDHAAHIRQFDMGLTTERIRLGWRGVRWISANILGWEGDLVLPESLDRTLPSKPALKALPTN